MSDSPETSSDQSGEQNPPADIDETGQPSLGSSGADVDSADDSAGDQVAPDSITDDQLPEDLRPGDDNPLARPRPDGEAVDLGIGETGDESGDGNDDDSGDESGSSGGDGDSGTT
jgi:hypothetical protein